MLYIGNILLFNYSYILWLYILYYTMVLYHIKDCIKIKYINCYKIPPIIGNLKHG